MTVKAVVQQQYRRVVNGASGYASIPRPPEGWLRTVRKALGMSGAQLGRRMGFTRARIGQAEQAELTGGATLKSMQAAASAMGCRFVYAIVPETSVEEAIAAQARKKALAIVTTASTHMALEDQVLPTSKIAQEVERIARELAQRMPPDFWDDK